MIIVFFSQSLYNSPQHSEKIIALDDITSHLIPDLWQMQMVITKIVYIVFIELLFRENTLRTALVGVVYIIYDIPLYNQIVYIYLYLLPCIK